MNVYLYAKTYVSQPHRHGMGDEGVQACECSLWDLLEPDLQRRVIEWALELRKSEAKQQYEIIKSMDFASRFSDFELPSNWNGMCSELQELLREICANERCLLALQAGEDGEIAGMQASLQNIINPEPLVFDFGDIDLSELIIDAPQFGPDFENIYLPESDTDAQGP